MYMQQSLACSCVGGSNLDHIAQSDFIATAKIKNINNFDEHFKRLDINVIKLYKGTETTSLEVFWGDGSSCGLMPAIDSTWLIYASRYGGEYLRFDLCSQSMQMDNDFKNKSYDTDLDLRFELLDYLKNNDIHVTNDYELSTYFKQPCLRNIDKTKIKKNSYAIYQLNINKELNISAITTLKKFETAADYPHLNGKVLSCINDQLRVSTGEKEKFIPQKTRLTLGLFLNTEVDYRGSYIYQSDHRAD